MVLLLNLLKKNISRILVTFLVLITLILGLDWGLANDNIALADILERDTTTVQNDEIIDTIDYESAKARRREKQAERSEQATENKENETAAEKLNLEELTPESNTNPFSQKKK